MDVAAAGVVDPPGPADLLGASTSFDALLDPPLDRLLGLVAELVAVGPEQLDAIVGERIVARPRSSRRGRRASSAVSIATAGVGIGPSRTTSMPTEVKPATIADSIM